MKTKKTIIVFSLVAALVFVNCSESDYDDDTETSTNTSSDTDTDTAEDTDPGTDTSADTDTDADTDPSDECCADDGQRIECWWQDAEQDGVTCTDDSVCAPNTCEKDAAVLGGEPSPTGVGLCRCTYDETDIEGGYGDCPGDGVCRPDGICRPSYCNGYLTCSCWGGCELELFGTGDWNSPAEYCVNDLATGAPYCCDGVYPETPGTEATGYRSAVADCSAD